MQYLIDRDELLRLREEKMIPDRFYVYLAIKLSYSSSNPSIDIPSFCEKWELTEVQLATAIAQLHKKGALQPVARQLQLELF
jgi:hypothetical protein